MKQQTIGTADLSQNFLLASVLRYSKQLLECLLYPLKSSCLAEPISTLCTRNICYVLIKVETTWQNALINIVKLQKSEVHTGMNI